MSKLEQSARQAIHKINQATALDEESDELLMEALTALREALDHSGEANEMVAEQAEQEPVAWWDGKETAFFEHELYGLKAPAEFHIPLYAAPVRTKDPCNPLQDLTDEEINDVMEPNMNLFEFARAVIAADREKNK